MKSTPMITSRPRGSKLEIEILLLLQLNAESGALERDLWIERQGREGNGVPGAYLKSAGRSTLNTRTWTSLRNCRGVALGRCLFDNLWTLGVEVNEIQLNNAANLCTLSWGGCGVGQATLYLLALPCWEGRLDTLLYHGQGHRVVLDRRFLGGSSLHSNKSFCPRRFM